MQEISNNIGIILGILSIIATAFFAHRYSEKKSPKFMYKTLRKIQRSSDAPDDIEVYYKGHKVDGVQSTVVWFWNDGRKPIVRSDIPVVQPIKIELNDSNELEILNVQVLKQSREVISSQVSKISNKVVQVSFEFLDYNDGFSLEILHTGKSSTDVDVSGTVLGAPQGIKCVNAGGNTALLIMDLSTPSRSRRERSLSKKLALTVLFTAIFGGLSYFLFSLSGEFTITSEIVSDALAEYLPPEQLEKAVEGIEESAKYKTFGKIAPYLMGSIFIINMLLGYWAIWGRRLPYPKSIANIDMKEPEVEPENIEQVNAADAQTRG
jgi:hypothetical protein